MILGFDFAGGGGARASDGACQLSRIQMMPTLLH